MERKMIVELTIKEMAEQLCVETSEINEESNLIEDLGADSLDTVEILMALEERFKFTISEKESEQLHTVKDIVDYLEKKLS